MEKVLEKKESRLESKTKMRVTGWVADGNIFHRWWEHCFLDQGLVMQMSIPLLFSKYYINIYDLCSFQYLHFIKMGFFNVLKNCDDSQYCLNSELLGWLFSWIPSGTVLLKNCDSYLIFFHLEFLHNLASRSVLANNLILSEFLQDWKTYLSFW